jgi:hypothetical protein
MSLWIVAVVGLAGAAAVGLARAFARRRQPKNVAVPIFLRGGEGEPGALPDGHLLLPPSESMARKRGSLALFPFQLGDVMTRPNGESAWLSSVAILFEDGPVAALYVAPDTDADAYVFVRVAPKRQVFWLAGQSMEEARAHGLLVSGEPPSRLPWPAPLERVRRYSAGVELLGASAPDFPPRVTCAEYTDGVGRRALLLVDGERAWLYVGESLENEALNVLGPGTATDE